MLTFALNVIPPNERLEVCIAHASSIISALILDREYQFIWCYQFLEQYVVILSHLSYIKIHIVAFSGHFPRNYYRRPEFS